MDVTHTALVGCPHDSSILKLDDMCGSLRLQDVLLIPQARASCAGKHECVVVEEWSPNRNRLQEGLVSPFGLAIPTLDQHMLALDEPHISIMKVISC